MKERINYDNGYYFGDTTVQYSNGRYIKMKHGMGTYYWNDGSSLSGEFRNDVIVRGTHNMSNGACYSGAFLNWSYEGFGTFHYVDGCEYEGYFSKGLRNGKGKLRWNNGDVYEGDYVNDLRHGQGKYSWSNGDVYEGGWFNDDRQGQGKMVSANGMTYVGQYVKNNREGRGTITYINDNDFECKYSGMWKKDRWEGNGTFCGEGIRYEGEFVDGLYHGQGSFYFSEDIMDDNSLSEYENINWDESYQIRYIGAFKNNKFNGQGVLSYRWNNGSIFSGNFINNKLMGPAVKMFNIYRDEPFFGKRPDPVYDVYEGNCVNNKFVGMVKVTRGKTNEVETLPATVVEKIFEDDYEYFDEFIGY